MATSILFPRNDNNVYARAITDPNTGLPVNDGTCTWSLNTKARLPDGTADPDNTIIASGSGTYVTGSDGDYRVDMPDTMAIRFGTSYWLIVRVDSAEGTFEVEREVLANRRTGQSANT
jgi:hypothetical protein